MLNGRARAFSTRSTGAFSIKWMAHGRARYEVDRRVHTVSAQSAVLVGQDQPYEAEFEARSGAESFCLFFSSTLVGEAWASVEAGFAAATGDAAPRAFPNVSFSPSRRLTRVLQALQATGPASCETLLEARVLTAVAEAVSTASRHRRLIARVPATRPSARAHLLTLLERARDAITEAHGVGASLGGLARDAGMSKFHFLRMFKAVYGLTPIACAERARVDRGASMLSQTRAPVGEIAAALGYESPSAFAKVFRRWRGAAPSVWRI
ncbi:MAG TPA: AraC family transcriptional regulator [Caulobacteraceae bacterium]